MQAENCKLVHVDGGMTPLCNPGDRFIHKLLQADSRLSYETWALQQPLVKGHVPSPPRSLSAKWFHDAMSKLTAASIVRSFVACRVLRIEDYTVEQQKAYRLKELESASLQRSVKDMLIDNPEFAEFAAQLEDMSDDEEWLQDENITHQPASPGQTPPGTPERRRPRTPPLGQLLQSGQSLRLRRMSWQRSTRPSYPSLAPMSAS